MLVIGRKVEFLMPIGSDQLLTEMGIIRWRERRPLSETPIAEDPDTRPEVIVDDIARKGASSSVLTKNVHALDWPALKVMVEGCQRCELHRSRTQTVFGVGALNADLLIIGEAPGQNEDRLGEPFVGRAGQLLNAMLKALGMGREAVYIANTLKCRPPGNRDPKREETEACASYLERQIALLAPRVILAVGRIAAQTLLASEAPLGRMRGRAHHLPGTDIPVIVTYHPAYLLRSPAQKRQAWSDLLMARQYLRETPG